MNAPAPLHARLSPSGAYRWMSCPGSVAMEDGEPNTSNEYSDEGTAAHWLAARCLEERKHPAAFIGRVIRVVNGIAEPDVEPPDPKTVREFTVDAEFAGDVNTYVQKIREYEGRGQLYIEQSLPIGHVTGEEGATGTGDAVVITADLEELQVHDLKFGRGVKVFAENNPQLGHYALGAVEKFKDIGPFKRVRFVIHQPRLGHLSEWDCTIEQLQSFAAFARQRAQHAMSVLNNEHPGAIIHHLKPSETACKFCKAKGKCPALAKLVSDTVGADFAMASAIPHLSEPLRTEKREEIAPPDDLKTLGVKLAAVDLIEDWCRAVRAKAEAALFKHYNAPEAVAALGYKLVLGKKGNRQWADTAAVEAALKSMRLKSEEIYDFKVKSPTAITKHLKDQPKRLAKIEPLITQADGKPSVAPANDPRPALVITPPAADFAVPLTPAEASKVGLDLV